VYCCFFFLTSNYIFVEHCYVMENPTGTRNPPETRWVRVRDSTRGCDRGRVWSHFAGAVAGGFLLHPTRTRPVAIPKAARSIGPALCLVPCPSVRARAPLGRLGVSTVRCRRPTGLHGRRRLLLDSPGRLGHGLQNRFIYKNRYPPVTVYQR
jgi:hypothetical protein